MQVAVFEKVLGQCRAELAGFDPALVSAPDAARLFSVLNELERTVVAAKTLVAERATEAGQWQAAGHRDAASWVAATTGTALGQARGLLERSSRLAALPETTEALRRGELSAPQLQAVTAGATAHPGSERQLLETAASSTLADLQAAA